MQLRRMLWTSAAILMAATLASCNIGKAPEPTPDVNGIYTAAAQTMVSALHRQLTQTAQALPPTATATPLASPTPLPTFGIATGSIPFGTPGTAIVFGTLTTPVATLPAGTGVYSFPVGCSDAMFIGEKGPSDGTVITAGTIFTKSWSLQNVGTCTWDQGFTFAFKSGDRMQGDDVPFLTKDEFTAPGHSQAFNIKMQAPNRTGEYKGFWQMKNDSGQWFGSLVYVDIVVAGKETPLPTRTP